MTNTLKDYGVPFKTLIKRMLQNTIESGDIKWKEQLTFYIIFNPSKAM